MKKSTYLFWMFAYLFVVAGWAGCKDRCKGANCPKDMDMPEYMEKRIPYQVGQVVRFANATGDTINMTCSSKTYYEQPVTPGDNFELECCTTVFVGAVGCSLRSEDNVDKIGMSTTFFPTSSPGGFYVTNYGVTLDGVNYNEDDYYGYQQDVIEINGITFNNVLTIDTDSTFILYNSLDGLGVVGFKINGEEWGLVE